MALHRKALPLEILRMNGNRHGFRMRYHKRLLLVGRGGDPFSWNSLIICLRGSIPFLPLSIATYNRNHDIHDRTLHTLISRSIKISPLVPLLGGTINLSIHREIIDRTVGYDQCSLLDELLSRLPLTRSCSRVFVDHEVINRQFIVPTTDLR